MLIIISAFKVMLYDIP